MTESKVCPTCGKEFFPAPEDVKGFSFRKKKYCSPECYAKYHQRGNSHKTFVCLWCHEQFKTKGGMSAHFCCAEERVFYCQKRTAIEAVYPWSEDREKRDKELEKLRTQGQDYKLPKRK